MKRVVPEAAQTANGRSLGNERGQTLVEYTVVLLTVLTVIFGVFESARLTLAYTTLAEATRAGVRYAIVHGAYCSGACIPGNGQAQAQSVALAGGVTITAYNTSYAYPAAANTAVPGTLVVVTATASFAPVTPLVALGVPLSSTAEGMITY